MPEINSFSIFELDKKNGGSMKRQSERGGVVITHKPTGWKTVMREEMREVLLKLVKLFGSDARLADFEIERMGEVSVETV